jgi:hypothetical protein
LGEQAQRCEDGDIGNDMAGVFDSQAILDQIMLTRRSNELAKDFTKILETATRLASLLLYGRRNIAPLYFSNKSQATAVSSTVHAKSGTSTSQIENRRSAFPRLARTPTVAERDKCS